MNELFLVINCELLLFKVTGYCGVDMVSCKTFLPFLSPASVQELPTALKAIAFCRCCRFYHRCGNFRGRNISRAKFSRV